ncbi:MAG: transporter [Chitinophagaceae bacterium]|nr:MAG: transporter [Chitinophagaceae bacterium]
MRMQITRPLLPFLLFASVQAAAQDAPFDSDRPSETQSVQTVGKSVFQAENGVRKEQESAGRFSVDHPATALRWGLSKKLELRAELTAATEHDHPQGGHRYGLRPVELGMKAALLEEKGGRPALTILGQVGIPALASKDHRSLHAQPQFRLLFENSLGKSMKLTYNAGAEWNGEDTEPDWLYTISPQWDLGSHWQLFVEEFAYFHRGQEPRHTLDGGVAFLPARELKLDLSAGVGISHAAPDYFLAAGISFRIK